MKSSVVYISADEIITDWHAYDPATDFVYSSGKPTIQQYIFTQIRIATEKRVFIFVKKQFSGVQSIHPGQQ